MNPGPDPRLTKLEAAYKQATLERANEIVDARLAAEASPLPGREELVKAADECEVKECIMDPGLIAVLIEVRKARGIALP